MRVIVIDKEELQLRNKKKKPDKKKAIAAPLLRERQTELGNYVFGR